MSINISELIKLNDLVSLTFRRKHIIVLNPEEEYENKEDLNENIVYDKTEWKISENLHRLIEELSKDYKLNNEDKILLVFKKLCENYIYDDNVISYIQKIDDESYNLPDWYGRDIDQEWEKNREQHNRRVCYEVSRYLAEAFTELFKDEEDFNVCILWDKGLTHYFVGLTCDDYSITLDLDDFNNIKDLTRIKAGLTAQGIVILEDHKGKFKSALDKFNENRSNDAIKKIEREIYNTTESPNASTENETYKPIAEAENIYFLKNAIDILKEKYNIDSQGLYEYMKEIVDIKLGPESRKKVWKKLNGNNKETRYIRCLVIDVNNEKYMLDVDEMLLRTFNEEELTKKDSAFIPYKDLSRDWDERYDGS